MESSFSLKDIFTLGKGLHINSRLTNREYKVLLTFVADMGFDNLQDTHEKLLAAVKSAFMEVTQKIGLSINEVPVALLLAINSLDIRERAHEYAKRHPEEIPVLFKAGLITIDMILVPYLKNQPAEFQSMYSQIMNDVFNDLRKYQGTPEQILACFSPLLQLGDIAGQSSEPIMPTKGIECVGVAETDNSAITKAITKEEVEIVIREHFDGVRKYFVRQEDLTNAVSALSNYFYTNLVTNGLTIKIKTRCNRKLARVLGSIHRQLSAESNLDLGYLNFCKSIFNCYGKLRLESLKIYMMEN